MDAMDLARSMMSGGISNASAEMAAAAAGSGVSIEYYIQMFSALGLPESIIQYISGAVGRISDIINASGVQIIIFIAALQSIPGYYKLVVNTDAAMCPAPDLNQKKEILLNAVEALHALGYEDPKVACLCC